MSRYSGIQLATRCEWVTSPEGNRIEFCCKETVSPHSYCAEHLRKAYRSADEEEFETEVKKNLETDAEPGDLDEEDIACLTTTE